MSAQSHGSPHIVEALCPSCGLMNYFDKNNICKKRDLYRGNSGVNAEHKRDLYLKCQRGHDMVVPVNCRGYE